MPLLLLVWMHTWTLATLPPQVPHPCHATASVRACAGMLLPCAPQRPSPADVRAPHCAAVAAGCMSEHKSRAIAPVTLADTPRWNVGGQWTRNTLAPLVQQIPKSGGQKRKLGAYNQFPRVRAGSLGVLS